MKPQNQIDLFYVGDDAIAAGSLTTKYTDHEYSTRIRFTLPNGNDVTGSLDLKVNGSVLSWSTFRFEGDGRVVTGERGSDGVRIDGETVPVDGEVIPGYACSGLVVEFANSTADSIDFTLLVEAADTPANSASLNRAGTETVTSPVRGTVDDCVKVELTVNWTRTNTYWVKGAVIVLSDWAGARSYALPDPVVQSLIS